MKCDFWTILTKETQSVPPSYAESLRRLMMGGTESSAKFAGLQDGSAAAMAGLEFDLRCVGRCGRGGIFSGDAFSGDAFSGDAFSGDAFSGDAFSGDAFASDAFASDAFASDAFVSDAFVSDAFVSDAFAAVGSVRSLTSAGERRGLFRICAAIFS